LGDQNKIGKEYYKHAKKLLQTNGENGKIDLKK
jgi:hypothetical protein